MTNKQRLCELLESMSYDDLAECLETYPLFRGKLAKAIGGRNEMLLGRILFTERRCVMNLEEAMKLWKQYHGKPASTPFLVPTYDEIQAAYVLADRYLHDHDPELKSVIHCEECTVCLDGENQ